MDSFLIEHHRSSNAHGSDAASITGSVATSRWFGHGHNNGNTGGTSSGNGKSARSRPRLFPPVSMNNNRASLDDHHNTSHGHWSPAYASAMRNSKYSLGRMNLSSPSLESLDSGYPMSALSAEYQPAVGFASALSHVMARGDGASHAGESETHDATTASMFEGADAQLDDDTLELSGAPWMKEGNVKYKCEVDDSGKKPKDRHWTECFAVVQRGWLRLFSFETNNTFASRLRNRADKHRGHDAASELGPVVVGGGNWLVSAEEVQAIRLRQTIASAYPTSGYSRSKPHVWALSLSSGVRHLFQVGTEDIVKEFVFTANYWAARLSKEPLGGGISNIEYGWGDRVLQPSQPSQQQEQEQAGPLRANSAGAGTSVTVTKPPRTSTGGRPSFHSAVRGSFDGSLSMAIASSKDSSRHPATTTSTAPAAAGTHTAAPGDRVDIADWAAPQQSMFASALSEADQLCALEKYLTRLEDDMRRHIEVRLPMARAFTPRTSKSDRAMSNWDRKERYLASELRKTDVYIRTLTNARAAWLKVLKEREAHERGLSVQAAPSAVPA
ncbi:hypothetical protein KEM52_001771 [Ascosphaera acerosa]|nr:hypothetical protein KEM52_001771 [Ascosphaera acerosa]